MLENTYVEASAIVAVPYGAVVVTAGVACGECAVHNIDESFYWFVF
jgi:hypothetical protein